MLRNANGPGVGPLALRTPKIGVWVPGWCPHLPLTNQRSNSKRTIKYQLFHHFLELKKRPLSVLYKLAPDYPKVGLTNTVATPNGGLG